jgi:hypothetical protein
MLNYIGRVPITMSLDIVDLVIITIGAIIGVIALAILKIRVEPSEKKQYKKYSSFLLMGGSWFIVGLIFGVLYRGDSVFDAPLLSLGLIFLLAGGIGVIAEYLKH